MDWWEHPEQIGDRHTSLVKGVINGSNRAFSGGSPPPWDLSLKKVEQMVQKEQE